MRERRPGVWEFRLYVGRDPVTHKHRWLSHTWHGKARDAGKALAAWVTEQSGERALVPTSKTVGWLLAEWFADQERRQLSPTTMEHYRGKAATWITPAIGSVPLRDLVPGHVSELHARMMQAGKSDSTIRQTHAILRGALSYALEWEWIDRNVAAMTRPPRQGTPSVVAPDDDQVAMLLEAAGERGCDLWTCVALAATLGGRAGELCGMRWSDVDLVAGKVRIARSVYVVKGTTGIKALKTGPRGALDPEDPGRTVSIDPSTVAALRDRWAWQVERARRIGTDLVADPYVLSFWSDGNGPPRPDSYSSAFGKLRTSLGLGHLNLHSLRHFMVTTALDAGIPMPVVSERAGHSSTAVTARIYAHGKRGRDEEAAAVLGRVLATPALEQTTALNAASTATIP
jgi:integrase